MRKYLFLRTEHSIPRIFQQKTSKNKEKIDFLKKICVLRTTPTLNLPICKPQCVKPLILRTLKHF